jgi:hypothetical protein
MRHFSLANALTALLITVFAAAAGPARAKNIFDFDDKEVGPATVTTEPVKAQPAIQPPATVRPPEESKTVVTAKPVALVSSHRIPPIADRQGSQKAFKELFAKEISDPDPAARRKLSEKLLAETKRSGITPSDRIVLLMGARQAAQEGKDLPLCFQAIDDLEEHFDVNARDLRMASAILVTGSRSTVPAVNAANCMAGLGILDDLLTQGKYVEAAKLVRSLSVLAAADPALQAEAGWYEKRIDQTQRAFDRNAKFRERLKSAPKDPDAVAAIGQFLCFYQGTWKSGLALLADGSDPKLRDLARADLATGASTDPAASVEVADKWWQIAEGQPEVSREMIRKHAAELYQQGLGSLAGLRRDVIAKRMASIRKGLSMHWIVAFRSDNPTIWSHPAGRATDANGFAADIDSLPDEVKFLRIRRMDTGAAAIIPMTKDSLLKPSATWSGTAWVGYGGVHLGIKDPKTDRIEKGLVDIDEHRQGWGFGHIVYAPEDQAQGYAWNHAPIPRAIFEISVTKDDLLSHEQREVVLQAVAKPN